MWFIIGLLLGLVVGAVVGFFAFTAASYRISIVMLSEITKQIQS